ncbi:MAG TPA: HD domain-containing protein [Candidatus Caccomorpha excrementavium]|nr:HD domain-containing protein [Candidatus Caccomorpha excrementavium]
MRYIAELREGEMISETYLCKQKQALKTKAGKNYYSLLLQDKTGILDAKIWDLGAGIDHFEQMEYIHVDGQVISFQGSPQLNIKRLRRSQEGEYDPADFMPMTERNIDEMYHELISLAGKVRDPFMRALVSSFFIEDKEFAAAFCRHSAAKTVHHGFIGGLLEHTLGVMRLCDYMADRYPVLNRDLLLASALFHDIGKLKELSYFPENDYTDEGQLLGHIYMGAEMVSERIRRIPDFPQKMANEIIHCILAHHGELEYGSPKKPALAEALALNLADNTDAKLQTMTELLRSSDEKGWLGYQKLFDSNVRRTSEYGK